MKLHSWVGHRVREFILYLQWVMQSNEKSVIFLPSSSQADGASNLRAYCVADELKKIGWRTIVVPHQVELKQRQRIVKLLKPDILYFQMARHAANRYDYFHGNKIVFDIDDADYLDDTQVNAIESFCKKSNLVIAGSKIVKNWCEQFNKESYIVWTGTPEDIVPQHIQKPSERAPIVAWGCSMSLAYPKELEFILRVLNQLAERRSKFVFRLYGVTDKQKAEQIFGHLNDKGIVVEYFEYMSYQSFLDSLGDVAIGLNPLLPQKSRYSEGKSFGKVLAYLIARCVVIASDAVDHSDFFKNTQNGIIASSEEDWVDAIDMYIQHPEKRDAITERALDDFKLNLTTKVSAKKISDLLHRIV